VKLSKTGGMDGGSVAYVETLEPSDGWSLDILSVKNEEKQSGSVILAVVVGRAEGGLRRRRLFIVCHRLRGCDSQSFPNGPYAYISGR